MPGGVFARRNVEGGKWNFQDKGRPNPERFRGWLQLGNEGKKKGLIALLPGARGKLLKQLMNSFAGKRHRAEARC
jgi:hypothetical protein